MNWKIMFATSLLLVTNPFYCWSDDLGDGIEIDDSISKYDDLNSIQENINFIKMNEKSKVYTTMDDTGSTGSGDEDSMINSVYIESGGTVHGDIIIIDEGKEGHTLIAD